MAAPDNANQPLTLRQKIAGAVASSGVVVPTDQLSTLVDAIVAALEPPKPKEAPLEPAYVWPDWPPDKNVPTAYGVPEPETSVAPV